MYEMYPDTWFTTADQRELDGAKPRRRARKAHSVLPALIMHREQRDADAPHTVHPPR